MHSVCSNNAICHLCDGKRLFKDPVAERKAKQDARDQKVKEQKNALLRTYSKEKKEGMGFEKRVQKKWNQKLGGSTSKPVAKPRIDVTPAQKNKTARPYNEAKRQPNSGATWAAKGDIKLEHALMECKERGTMTSKGEKQIAIMKDWLDKMVIEAFKEGRDYWYLPFGFKGDDDIYLVKPYDHEMHLIYELRQAHERIAELEEMIKEDKDGSDA
jgi:hypothetical protein